MENTNQFSKKKALRFHPPGTIDKIKAEYITGLFTINQLSNKYLVMESCIFRACKSDSWREHMEQNSIAIPREPRPAFATAPLERWDAAEADFMRGTPVNVLAKTHGISEFSIRNRIKKYKWKFYKEQLDEARKKRAAGINLAARMAEFDDTSAIFVEAAVEQIRSMIGELTANKRNMKPELLEKLIKMHSGMYEAVKKLPTGNTTGKNSTEDIHPALRPAKIVKMG